MLRPKPILRHLAASRIGAIGRAQLVSSAKVGSLKNQNAVLAHEAIDPTIAYQSRSDSLFNHAVMLGYENPQAYVDNRISRGISISFAQSEDEHAQINHLSGMTENVAQIIAHIRAHDWPQAFLVAKKQLKEPAEVANLFRNMIIDGVDFQSGQVKNFVRIVLLQVPYNQTLAKLTEGSFYDPVRALLPELPPQEILLSPKLDITNPDHRLRIGQYVAELFEGAGLGRGRIEDYLLSYPLMGVVSGSEHDPWMLASSTYFREEIAPKLLKSFHVDDYLYRPIDEWDEDTDDGSEEVEVRAATWFLEYMSQDAQFDKLLQWLGPIDATWALIRSKRKLSRDRLSELIESQSDKLREFFLWAAGPEGLELDEFIESFLAVLPQEADSKAIREKKVTLVKEAMGIAEQEQLFGNRDELESYLTEFVMPSDVDSNEMFFKKLDRLSGVLYAQRKAALLRPAEAEKLERVAAQASKAEHIEWTIPDWVND